MFSFDKRIASRGYHMYRNSNWKNVKAGYRVKVEKETSATSKSIDPYACAIKIKNRFFENWITVGHIPKEISRHCYFFMKEGGEISGYLVSTNYKPSPIPAGGLEVPLLLTFSVKNEQIFEQMKEFVTTLYDYEYKGMNEDESKDEDSDDENVIELKLSDGEGQTGPRQTTIELEGKQSREEPVLEDQNKENVQIKEKAVIEID